MGLVVGATDAEALARVRAAAPDLWILAPGTKRNIKQRRFPGEVCFSRVHNAIFLGLVCREVVISSPFRPSRPPPPWFTELHVRDLEGRGRCTHVNACRSR